MIPRHLIVGLLLLVGLSAPMIAQPGGDCTYQLAPQAQPFDSTQYQDLAKVSSAKIYLALNNELSTLDAENKKIQRQLEELYTDRTEYLQILLADQYFFFEEDLLQVIQDLSAQLLAANEIRNEGAVHFLVSRSGIPNASCLGDGSIILNLGLISRLENYEQLAFIMAHELAHHHLDHVNQNMHKRAKLINSSEMKQRLKAANKGQVRALTKLAEALEENEISLAKHSREHELETDALGFEFYQKSGFSNEHAYSALAFLQQLDKDKYELPALNTVFDFPDFPWQEHWDDSHLSGLSLVALSDEEKELYRTHPQLTERISQIMTLGADSVGQVKKELCESSILYDLEILERQYEIGNVFLAFQLGLQLTQINPENTFAKAIVANCLLDFAIARKEHTFSKIAPSPNRKFSTQLNNLATFLDNLSFKEMVTISKRYAAEHIDINASTKLTEELKTKLKKLN